MSNKFINNPRKESIMLKTNDLKPYNPNLREILQATNPNQGVVLNRQFAEWEEHLADHLVNRLNHSTLYTYNLGEDKKLFQQAQEHVEHHRQTIESNNTVIIIHPFYLPLSHKSILDGREELQKESDTYLERLVNFLHWRKEEARSRVVLFETLHHYAIGSSLLLEQGLVDDVLFTYYETGKLLQEDQNKQFKDNTVYTGGGYNYGCLLAALGDLIVLPVRESYAIMDLTVEHPDKMDQSIHPEEIYFKWNEAFPQDHCLTTKEVKEKLKRK